MTAADRKTGLLTHVISALNENADTLPARMNIGCDAVIVNQCGEDGVRDSEHNGHSIRIISSTERGVGNSRNTGLLNVKTPYVLIGDEDIVYRDGYAEAVIKEFETHTGADVLLFNVDQSTGRKTYHSDSYGRVHFYNCGRYPAYSIAMRTDVWREANVWFSLLFGGGAKYAAGEDSIFIMDLLRAGVRVYHVPVCLGTETDRESTWFKGFDDKYFRDRGRLYRSLYGHFAPLMCVYFLIRKRKEWLRGRRFFPSLSLMLGGMR